MVPLRAVIALTPRHVDVELAEVRRRFDPQFDLVPSHLTLVFPHRLGSAALVGHVRAVAAGHGPIQIRLMGLAGSGESHLFARVTRGNDELIALHDDLYTGVLAAALDRSSIFVPHVAVGRLESAAALRTALDSMDHHLSLEFQVRELTIYRLPGERAGGIEASLPLSVGSS